eukprot:jgi/Mesvir1/14590/Mv25030-RA.1
MASHDNTGSNHNRGGRGSEQEPIDIENEASTPSTPDHYAQDPANDQWMWDDEHIHYDAPARTTSAGAATAAGAPAGAAADADMATAGLPAGATPLLASVQAAIAAVASARPAQKRKSPGGPPKPRSKPKWQQELEAKLEAAEKEKALVEKALAESRGVLEAVYRTCHFCTDPFGDNEDDCPVKYALPKVDDEEVEHKCPTISCAKCAHTVLYTRLGNHCCPSCRAWVVSYHRDEEMSKAIFEDINVQYCAPCDKVFPIGGHVKHAKVCKGGAGPCDNRAEFDLEDGRKVAVGCEYRAKTLGDKERHMGAECQFKGLLTSVLSYSPRSLPFLRA